MPIFDQGYQHWSGTLSGHAWRWLAITRRGVRTGMKGRILRLILIFSWIPALLLAFALSVWGLIERKFEMVTPIVDLLVSMHLLDPKFAADPHHYRVAIWTLCYDFFLITELYLSMILVVLVGPGLISQDLRFNALPLYFSRPLRRIDYFIGKLGVIAAFLGMVVVLPSLIAYVLGLLFSLDFTIVRDTFRLLLSSIAYGTLIAVSAGVLMLALSSLSRRSLYTALMWLVFWLVSWATAGFLESTQSRQRSNESARNAQVANLQAAPPANAPDNPAQRLHQQREAQEALQKVRAEQEASEWEASKRQLEATKRDWRPLVSYTANLSRIGRELLGTADAWRTVSQQPTEFQQDRFVYDRIGAQYPWYWSAGVLAGLFGISVCILNFRVKSMDRLR
jgi:ABC-2 type transport system permease protein